MLDKLKNMFGPTQEEWDAAAKSIRDAEKLRNQQYQTAMMQAQQTAMSIQNQAARNQATNIGAAMAGGAGAVGLGMASGQLGQINAYNHMWGTQLSPVQIRDKTRNHIANEVEKMAEEIGAPTLLHAVVLAIRTMEIPE